MVAIGAAAAGLLCTCDFETQFMCTRISAIWIAHNPQLQVLCAAIGICVSSWCSEPLACLSQQLACQVSCNALGMVRMSCILLHGGQPVAVTWHNACTSTCCCCPVNPDNCLGLRYCTALLCASAVREGHSCTLSG